MTQTWALLVDSWRQLRSRYLFWITLALSAFAAIVLFGTMTFNERGIKILWFSTIENPMLASGGDGPKDFVAGLFNGVFVKIWLGWGAMILALISTASILPEFLSSGSIDLTISKPIRRVSVFLNRIAGAMLFVLLQLFVGVTLAIVLMRVRSGIWLPEALWAIPLVLLQFFYLYSVAALIAVQTRSTLASLLGTVLFWFVIFILQFASSQMDAMIGSSQEQVRISEQRIESIMSEQSSENASEPLALTKRMRQAKDLGDQSRSVIQGITPWQKRLHGVMWVIPKTGDVQKIIANVTKAPVANEWLNLMMDTSREEFRPSNINEEEWNTLKDAETAGQRAKRRLDTAASIGSSVAFSCVMIGLGAFIFARRDF